MNREIKNRRFKRIAFVEDMVSDLHTRLIAVFQRLWLDTQIRAISNLLKDK